jgi:subtilase family serine protease
MQGTVALAKPAAAIRPYVRTGVAFLIVLVMIVPGSAMALASGSPYAVTPHGGLPVAAVSNVLSGAQLQKGPFLQNPGSPISALPNVSVQGPVDPNQKISFTVGFQMRNANDLATIISEQQTPGSGMYHQWLTLEQEQTLFGPDQTTIQNTENYFTSLGFHVGTVGLLSVSFVGTAAQANSAFKTSLVNVLYGTGSKAYLNDMPLALPSAIAPAVVSVNGLDSATVAHPTNSVDPQAVSDFAHSVPSEDLPSFSHALYNVTNESAAYNYTNHAFMWFRYYSHHYHVWKTYQTLTPAALSLMYQAMPLVNAGINGNSSGTPITIAIVMAGGINPGDISGFSQLVWNNPNQILKRLVAVPVDRSFGLNGTLTYTDGASGEMALDIEFTSTMAPGARIMPVYGPTLASNILDDVYATLANMRPTPNIVSNSWGGEEDRWPNLYGPNWANALTMHDYILALSARGSTVLASSADGGGFDKATGIMSGSYPATDPYVFSVDGVRTSANGPGNVVFPTTDTFGTYQESIYALPNETVHINPVTGIQSQSFWYEPNTNLTAYAPPSGSGGFGTSYWWTQPWFQHGLSVPNVGRALGSSVSAEADFNQTIFFDGYFQWLYGGTSFACPTTAGEFALIDDYLQHNGQSAYVGTGDVPVFDVANAYYNGNVSLVPFYDVTNGTSYWGNYGAAHGYEWPPGQVFPKNAEGNYTYGTTLKGWDFPTGWGTINVANFAQDLLTIERMPGTFITVNLTTARFAPTEWANLQLNHTYTIHLNASGAFGASNPIVALEFFGTNGINTTWYPTTSAVLAPSAGLNFQLNTSSAPFGPLFSPGLLILTAGNGSNRNAGFFYDWIAQDIPTGALNVTVVAPSTSGVVGGYPEFNGFLGFFYPTVYPACCGSAFPNTFTVRVTLNGAPVYDAQVLANVQSAGQLAFSNSRAEQTTQSYGSPHYESPTIVSVSLTNQTGIALVYTWNVIAPTTFFVNATYGPNTALTTYQVLPGPNVGTTDNYGGRMSNFNIISWILYAFHITQNNNQTTPLLNTWEPNALNQTALWNLMYGWQGERLPVHVNNYTGAGLSGAKVWLGTFDNGRETKFLRYESSGGVMGVTNYTNTTNITDNNGNAYVQIPDNMSDQGFFSSTANGQTAGWGFVATDVPGSQNRTFQYTETCTPNLPNPSPLIRCEFNNSYQRNYTTAPIIILPNPVNLTLQTPSKLPLDFFGIGANVSFEVNVTLPGLDPVAGNNIAFNWPSGQEHIVTEKAYVDGKYQIDVSPYVPPYWQHYTAFGNLSNNFAPGTHNLTVVVTDSAGHTFTQTQKFIVGGVTITNLGIKNIYTVVPFVVNWTLDIPASEVYNYSFNQSFDLRYVTPSCGTPRNPCPTVVNLSEKIHDGQVLYNQSINLTLMGLAHFYAGSGGYPPGQYQVIIWLNANHSGSIAKQVNTFLIFAPVQGGITGPGQNATVPIGNLTIAYAYQGGYIANASLFVYKSTSMTTPVFTAGAYVPAVGEQPRAGSSTWQAVETGMYEIVLLLGTPYANYTAHDWINVTNPNGLVYLNHTGTQPLISLSPAALSTILALAAVLIGLFLGLIAAPALRPSQAGAGAGRPSSSGPKPWDEGKPAGNGSPSGDGVQGGLSCPICHEPATSQFALHQHQQVVHGIEE